MTYRQAYDKIIEAYFKDEIKPMDGKFCFCGTLCGNSENWMGLMIKGYMGYSVAELVELESALLTPLVPLGIYNNHCQEEPHITGDWCGIIDETDKDYEPLLFAGMSAALDALKQIHIDRGEVIDEPAPFVQRKLTV